MPLKPSNGFSENGLAMGYLKKIGGSRLSQALIPRSQDVTLQNRQVRELGPQGPAGGSIVMELPPRAGMVWNEKTYKTWMIWGICRNPPIYFDR